MCLLFKLKESEQNGKNKQIGKLHNILFYNLANNFLLYNFTVNMQFINHTNRNSWIDSITIRNTLANIREVKRTTKTYIQR